MNDQDEPLLTEAHHAHLNWLCAQPAAWDDDGLRLGNQYVMFRAESALMRRHAQLLTEPGDRRCDVLEIGGGLGVFATEVLRLGVRSYTAVEPHPAVAAALRTLVADRAGGAATLVLDGPWQGNLGRFGQYDAIMYDTWPPDGLADRDFALFVDRVCAHHLRLAGRFSFFSSGEPSPERMRILDARFAALRVEEVELGLMPASWTKPTTCCTVCVAEGPSHK